MIVLIFINKDTNTPNNTANANTEVCRPELPCSTCPSPQPHALQAVQAAASLRPPAPATPALAIRGYNSGLIEVSLSQAARTPCLSKVRLAALPPSALTA